MAYILTFTNILLFMSCSFLHPSLAGQIFKEFIYPNFTAFSLQFIDNGGAFLSSPNGTFRVSIYNPGVQASSFYLCVIHVASNTIVWSANGNSPVSNRGMMYLTSNGISINNADGGLSWTTPLLNSAVMALQLLDDGNLVLLGKFNMSLWQSFDHPTDTILISQSLSKGKMLSSAVSDTNLTTGDYRFSVTSDDAVLQWRTQEYWRLSMDTRSFKHDNSEVSYMQMNQSGIYLFGGNGTTTVIWAVNLQMSDFQISMAKLDYKGRFNIISFSAKESPKLEFSAPVDDCLLPVPCGRFGICKLSNSGCSCPSGFHVSNNLDSACLPFNASESLPSTCNSNASFTYVGLGSGFRYFAHNFVRPTTFGDDFFNCQDLCTRNCSCLGFFYMNSSALCYLLKDPLGSFAETVDSEYKDSLGFIKMVLLPIQKVDDSTHNSKRHFPMLVLILIPCIGVLLSIIFLFRCVLWWKGSGTSKASAIKLGSRSSSFFEVLDAFPIPGLPARFTYEELKVATDHFKTRIGSGAYGAVYLGALPDKTPVAIKTINRVDIQGNEFCTEIAIIGKTRHMNLIRLMGFCAQGPHRLLVLEYMNRGSLDQALFGTMQPVLEWKERVNIALGAARGLAYLHSECENKIIHLDVKPENILLDDRTQVKISDFGLSKLINPEQTSIYTIMRGTRGYLAPEWLMNYGISDKIDVYSYGMVLLEIVRGRRNCFSQRPSEHIGDAGSDNRLSSSECQSFYYPLFALEMHQQGCYLDLVDPRLVGRVTSEEVERLVRIALCCLHLQPMLRPSMANVVAMLEGRLDICTPRAESLKFLFCGR